MNLKHKYIFDLELEVITGLHIGGNKDVYEVGGIDNPVIKVKRHDSAEAIPYIPGSSLKGKMRSLFEITNDLNDGENVSRTDKAELGLYPLTLFGNSVDKENPGVGKGRLTVRDFNLKDNVDVKDLIEVKYENTIDRKSGRAKNPRPSERVVPGTVFTGNMILDIFDADGDKEKELLSNLIGSLRLLNDDYLGGCGTRGYGQIKMSITKVTKKKRENYISGGESSIDKLDLYDNSVVEKIMAIA